MELSTYIFYDEIYLKKKKKNWGVGGGGSYRHNSRGCTCMSTEHTFISRYDQEGVAPMKNDTDFRHVRLLLISKVLIYNYCKLGENIYQRR